MISGVVGPGFRPSTPFFAAHPHPFARGFGGRGPAVVPPLAGLKGR